MNHEEKTEKFLKKDGREAFLQKTPLEELPIIFAHGSSSHKPNIKVQIQTSDMVLWVKFLDAEYFRPYGGFTMHQIIEMINICHGDTQIVALMELLAAGSE